MILNFLCLLALSNIWIVIIHELGLIENQPRLKNFKLVTRVFCVIENRTMTGTRKLTSYYARQHLQVKYNRKLRRGNTYLFKNACYLRYLTLFYSHRWSTHQCKDFPFWLGLACYRKEIVYLALCSRSWSKGLSSAVVWRLSPLIPDTCVK